MRRIALAAAFILGCAVAGWSQAYYEATGQTAVFTLAAPTTEIRSEPLTRAEKNICINVTITRGGITVTLPALQKGSADIALYDIKGRQMYRQRGYIGTTLRIETQAFAPGVYSMIVCIAGKNYARRVAVYGQGE